MANILQAIHTIISNDIPDVVDFYRSNNKINAVGDALELFIKDIFANTLNEIDKVRKQEAYERVFSYTGNANNPPDLMLKLGDAIEVKKLKSESAQIALNSSYPTAKLYSSSQMITKACRECEQWDEKDLLYAIGCVNRHQLSSLWLVYGDCYAASPEIYHNIKTKVIAGINHSTGVEFSPTKELGRVNRVDPLGITSLRIRGMWHVEHPQKVFEYLNVSTNRKNSKFRLFTLMYEKKYLSCPLEDREKLESIDNSSLQIKKVKISFPDNPVKRIAARLITYQI
ncbi:NgoPII family restriction endonuclease [Pleurocapsa sp. PCC 7319]|uniref:NgoPII family restriction endonuclease n=1 Tax=Pleurocapsa sp. PCC 7319 TaxID=118161 RepID=UPI00034C8C44|nr:NgoPII family restriction endonuclease [Pleurocapsa sp. PCC 7319]